MILLLLLPIKNMFLMPSEVWRICWSISLAFSFLFLFFELFSFAFHVMNIPLEHGLLSLSLKFFSSHLFFGCLAPFFNLFFFFTLGASVVLNPILLLKSMLPQWWNVEEMWGFTCALVHYLFGKMTPHNIQIIRIMRLIAVIEELCASGTPAIYKFFF